MGRAQVILPPAPQRPRTRFRDIPLFRVPLDRSNPTHAAGSNPANLLALLALEPKTRGRHGNPGTGDNDTSGGTYRWPLR